jgi:hypothetical protein
MIMASTTDPVLKLTLVEANRYAELRNKSAIRNALKVRSFAARKMIMRVSEITSQIATVDNEKSKWHMVRPCPPYINYQIDNMMNQIIDRHRKTVLKNLKSLMFCGKKTQSWYEAFLIVYLLLSTLEYATEHQQRYVAEAAGTVNSMPLWIDLNGTLIRSASEPTLQD